MSRRLLVTLLFTACFVGCVAGAGWLALHPDLPEARSFAGMLAGMAVFFGIPTIMFWLRHIRS